MVATAARSLSRPDALYRRAERSFEHWEVIKDVVDEVLDFTLNQRQSGHPGGSHSKSHLLITTMLSGAMRWDIRHPWLPYQDRFILSAGHAIPLVYSTLTVLEEVMRIRERRDGGEQFTFPDGGRWAITADDLLRFRHRGGLPGHAESNGKTLFLRFNTGPSGHGMPAAAGEALALKLAGLDQLKVFALEGEGGLTPGASAETRNAAWGLGLSNLVLLLDWNDFGIDKFRCSDVVPGNPDTWFGAYDWRVFGATDGMDWAPVTGAILEAARGENPAGLPTAVWARTRKGRGYGKFDNASHGMPHGRNSAEFWAARAPFMTRYGLEYEGAGAPAPDAESEQEEQTLHNLHLALSVLDRSDGLVEAVSDTLVELAAGTDAAPATFNLGGTAKEIFSDPALLDAASYPPELYRQPGERQPNRAAFGAWGSWINAYAREHYGRPLVIACSADLAESTNIAGFGKDFGELPGWGWYDRRENARGTVLPTEITEFTNAGLMVGLASVNLAADPFHEFDGFWGACSTYGSFSYLKYGPMRLFSQMAQDAEIELGKVIWVAGHSGPETADDSRTHFGIFETGVTQLFPEGAVIDLHPWEYNEVPVVLAAALSQRAPIVAIHLTRPAIEIPDRAVLRMPSHFEAARGAYLVRDFRPGEPRQGTVFAQGTTPMANLVRVLPLIDERGWNVRIVATISPQLFRLQPEAYRASVISPADRWDAMAITNRSLKLMGDWLDATLAAPYSLSADWDDRWRTGGTIEEVMDEARLTADHVLAAIERFVEERPARVAALRERMEEIAGCME